MWRADCRVKSYTQIFNSVGVNAPNSTLFKGRLYLLSSLQQASSLFSVRAWKRYCRTCLPCILCFFPFHWLPPSSFLSQPNSWKANYSSCCSIPICCSLPWNCPKRAVWLYCWSFPLSYHVLIPSRPQAYKHMLICMPRGHIYPETHFSLRIFQSTLLNIFLSLLFSFQLLNNSSYLKVRTMSFCFQ